MSATRQQKYGAPLPHTFASRHFSIFRFQPS
jgi:hypothetical protein